MKFATWYRFLYNGYEPDNEVKLTGELTTDGETYVVFEIWGSLTFNDGHSFVSILRDEDGQFRWRKGDEIGTTASFMDAWNKMPAYVTSPDHWEESPMTCHEQHP
ncbi:MULTISPECIES: hypothetical protein [unclassified Microcoleus]|uniref:hypothetical protein n=1 Tax=unclassified Microcoleus TaxID=2642155 RepID=UPI002FCE98F9